MTSPPNSLDPQGPAPGAIIAGKYRVDRVLGWGGMGVVVAAHHLQLDERVAIKLMLPHALGNAEAVARFVREARAAVKIKSEHIARVSDVGTLETGEPYMVMEYLEGEDLSEWLSKRGAVPLEQAVEFVIQACEALAEAHSLGIVHRDLKPANLFCARRSDGLLGIKVLDFGISKAALGDGGSQFNMTRTTAVMGSPLYMSPEQLESARNVDARGDIWALGAVLYELVSANPPFTADSLPGLVLQITQLQPISLRIHQPGLPEGLERVIARCMEKDRAKRYSNVAELAVALAEFAPAHARASVERVRRVIQAGGLSTGALDLPHSTARSGAAPAAVANASSDSRTQSSFGQTGASKRGAGSGVLYALLGVAAVGVAVGLVSWMRQAPKVASAASDSSASVVTAAGAIANVSAPESSARPAPIVAPAAAAPPTPALSALAVPPPAAPEIPKSQPKKPIPKKPAAELVAKAAPTPAPKPSLSPTNNPMAGLIEDRQ